ncbi:hypothetical protein M0802_011363 [Mischocyttarus mexicanus]|nr:hypothetical protein M0802_011363 [Mischocyttarus mexicanus]
MYNYIQSRVETELSWADNVEEERREVIYQRKAAAAATGGRSRMIRPIVPSPRAHWAMTARRGTLQRPKTLEWEGFTYKIVEPTITRNGMTYQLVDLIKIVNGQTYRLTGQIQSPLK